MLAFVSTGIAISERFHLTLINIGKAHCIAFNAQTVGELYCFGFLTHSGLSIHKLELDPVRRV
jgi:hypothetical protein